MSELFTSIIGEQLSSVEFVQDYLQLHFDGNTLTCYVWPNIVINSESFGIEDDGYRNAICKIITHKVKKIYFNDNESLILYFDNESEINLRLLRNESNLSLSEFAYYRGVNGEWFVLD